MSNVVFYLPSGQVVGHTNCQDGNEELAFNPATDLKIIVEDVPEAPIPQWRVTEDKQLIVVEEPPEYN